MLFGRYQLYLRKIGPIPPNIAGKEWQARYLCMRADEEVGQVARACAAGAAVLAKNLAGQEQGAFRNWNECSADDLEGRIDGLLALHLHGQFGIDDEIDVERPELCAMVKLGNRPVEPIRVFADDVHQNVAVDQSHFFFRGASSLYPRVISINSSVVMLRIRRRFANS